MFALSVDSFLVVCSAKLSLTHLSHLIPIGSKPPPTLKSPLPLSHQTLPLTDFYIRPTMRRYHFWRNSHSHTPPRPSNSVRLSVASLDSLDPSSGHLDHANSLGPISRRPKAPGRQSPIPCGRPKATGYSTSNDRCTTSDTLIPKTKVYCSEAYDYLPTTTDPATSFKRGA